MLYYIYKIVCIDDPTLTYVGFTNNFNRRKSDHKSSCNIFKDNDTLLNTAIRSKGGWDYFTMSIIEEVEVENKIDVEIIKEQHRVQLNATLTQPRFINEELEELTKQAKINLDKAIRENYKLHFSKKCDGVVEHELNKKITELRKVYREANNKKVRAYHKVKKASLFEDK